MNILIVNDDGINATGIRELAKELQKEHCVTIIAPDKQRSACSHSITLNGTLFVKKHDYKDITGECYSISGTPADCTRIGITTICKRKIDMIVSGINEGYNLGSDILYSGTVSAAIEGAINDIPSVAISCDGTRDGYEHTCKHILQLVNDIYKLQYKNIVYNINIPTGPDIKGVKVCSIGERKYDNVFLKTEDNDIGTVYKLSGSLIENNDYNTDVFFIRKGYITVSPLKYDMTNFSIIESLDGKININ